MSLRFALGSTVLACALVTGPVFGQAKKAKPAPAAPAPQKIDEEYTKLIKEYLQDPRITTELVDHMPASDTVPSPLKFLGRIPGKPGELTYAKDIYRYYEALAKASPRAKFWKIGQTEEGRDKVVLAIADEATIKDLDKYKDMLAKLGDPRKTTEEQAQRAHQHRQADLLGQQRHPFARNRRSGNADRAGLPPDRRRDAVHPDHPQQRHHLHHAGDRSRRPREARSTPTTTARSTGKPRLPLMYWGKYVQHDNNRDGMGQYLKLTQELHQGRARVAPHHPARSARSAVLSLRLHRHRPLQHLARPHRHRRMVAARPRPKSWRWPSAAFPASGPTASTTAGCPTTCSGSRITHNSFGRFYEVQSYGPDVNRRTCALPPRTTSREWYPPESAAAVHQVGTAQQHQHPGIGAAVRAEQGGEGTRTVPRELLAEEQARGRQGQERARPTPG